MSLNAGTWCGSKVDENESGSYSMAAFCVTVLEIQTLLL
jgi:hypothetical protein